MKIIPCQFWSELEKNNSSFFFLLQIFFSHALASIYLHMLIAACHIHTEHSTWNVSYFQPRTYFERQIQPPPLPLAGVHLLIDLQCMNLMHTSLGRWNDTPGCGVYIYSCMHLHTFHKENTLSAESASAGARADVWGIFFPFSSLKTPTYVSQCPSTEHSPVIWTNVCLALWW